MRHILFIILLVVLFISSASADFNSIADSDRTELIDLTPMTNMFVFLKPYAGNVNCVYVCPETNIHRQRYLCTIMEFRGKNLYVGERQLAIIVEQQK